MSELKRCPFCSIELMPNTNKGDLYVKRYGPHWDHPGGLCFLADTEVSPAQVDAWNHRVATQGADSIVAHPDERVSMSWAQYVALTSTQGADARPVNQCDGCMAGHIIGQSGLHEYEGHGYMTCQAKRYVGADARPVAIQDLYEAAPIVDKWMRDKAVVLDGDQYATLVDLAATVVIATRDATPIVDAQDAGRYRLVRQGKALTVRVPVKDKHVTYCIGDKPEARFSEAFDAAVDAQIAASAPRENT